jgi:hypothetical protein
MMDLPEIFTKFNPLLESIKTGSVARFAAAGSVLHGCA